MNRGKSYDSKIFPEFQNNNNNYNKFGKKFKSSYENVIKMTYYKPNEILKKLPNIANNDDTKNIELEKKVTQKFFSQLKNYCNFRYQKSNKNTEIKLNKKAKMLKLNIIIVKNIINTIKNKGKISIKKILNSYNYAKPENFLFFYLILNGLNIKTN